jgi:hypothetical protein
MAGLLIRLKRLMSLFLVARMSEPKETAMKSFLISPSLLQIEK